ncbi:MAG: hypothetical protein ACFFDT_14645 [Candidatus Hodarchaeota archaeon]
MDKTAFILIGTIVLLVSSISPAHATDNWQETFDGDDWLDDWWVTQGNFTVQDGFLNASGCSPHPLLGTCINSMWKNYTAVTGTWSLDVNFDDSERFFFFYFMGLEITPDVCKCHPEYGFILIINEQSHGKKVHLAYRAVNPDERGIVVSHSLTTEQQSGWLHFDIIRTEVGRMVICLNDTLIMDFTNNNFTSSEYINIHVTRGVKLDNIKYNDSIEFDCTATTTEEATTASSGGSTPSWTPIIVILSFAVVLLGKRMK